MKFATALLALATAAMASPTNFALEERHSDCKSCDWDHKKYGHGRHQGIEKPCPNWVPTTKDLIAIDVEAKICLNDEAEDYGLSHDSSIIVDLHIDVTYVHYRYPELSRLYCDPNYTCTKGEKINEEECWEHEWGEDSYKSNW
ncbi:hypothetical protein C2857_000720 [Epichloe festucae Fl1]|uniref:Uncharacterized protein n=1 Tax=Epichloe festucae (strain Fl1) TaxID=877507 RepID=A0A7S9KU74_EPIFF|nr:hypothetical protein C2857_000720 [Epichloe festucae Fl1]